jgi:hypothetical protein
MCTQCRMSRDCLHKPSQSANCRGGDLGEVQVDVPVSHTCISPLGLSATNAIRLVDLAIAGDDRDWPAALGFRFMRRGHPSVSVSICRVAVLGGTPRHLSLSQTSQAVL